MAVGRWHLQTQVVVVLEFLVLEPLSQFLWNNCLDSYPILACEGIVAAVALAVHIMSAHIASDLGVLVEAFQFHAFWVSIIF